MSIKMQFVMTKITFQLANFAEFNAHNMLTKNCIKRINSLQIKKFRDEQNCFVCEGTRLVDEVLSSDLEVKELYHLPDWTNTKTSKAHSINEVSAEEMKKISSLMAPSQVLAVVEAPHYSFKESELNNKLTLALDCIQDPGNLGTIIRLADWFGIDRILCSHDTADAYSPKVVQASMGAITRIKLIYCDLADILESVAQTMPIYGAFMEGENIYSANLEAKGVVVMGNEGNGISRKIERLVSSKIHIPTFANNRSNVESLNVAMATAIICSEFKRRHL